METVAFIVALGASVIGAISGIGGGIIIKPVMDAVSGYDVTTISFLSGCTVLSMSTVSLIRQRKSGVEMNIPKAMLLAAGGVIGGLAGKAVFNHVKLLFAENTVGAIQSLILLLCTLGVLVYMLNQSRIKTLRVESKAVYVLVGLGLGAISSFLGIGGGPVNIVALLYLFGMDNKMAAVNSLFIIFFSQCSSLVSSFIQGIPPFPTVSLVFMAVGGIGGGLIGSFLAKKMSAGHTAKFFSVVLVVVAVICGYNLIQFL